jgi:hypothetical protein
MLQEQAPEETGEHSDGEKEPSPTSDPPRAVMCQTAARDDAVEARMVMQGLAPAAEHRRDADLAAEMLGIGRMVHRVSAAVRKRMA